MDCALLLRTTIDVAGFNRLCNPTGAISHPAAVVHAVCLEQLLHAGARALAKLFRTNCLSLLGENYFYGTPLNPRAPSACRVILERIGFAVACGLVDFALGTDTGGYYPRFPRAIAEIWGFRPSHGFVSVAGVNPLAPSFESIGVLAQARVLAKGGTYLCCPAHRCPRANRTIH